MKEVIFIRHGLLEEPYRDYSKLSLEQLTALGKQEVDPHIAPIVEYKGPSLENVECVYIAESTRCKETADAVMKDIPLVEVHADKLFNEVPFDLSKLVTQQEFDEHKMAIVRQRIFDSIIHGKEGVESLESIYQRTIAIEQLLAGVSCEHILCVTHGFLMRFLDMHFRLKRDLHTFTVEEIISQPNYPNARGFVVEM